MERKADVKKKGEWQKSWTQDMIDER
jgi:hypothetical protein